MIGLIFTIVLLIVICIVVALLCDMLIARFGLWPETKPIAVVLTLLIGLVGIFGGGFRLGW